MWSRQLFIVWLIALTILTTQSHDIHKRGLLSRLFGGGSKSSRTNDRDLQPKERSRVRQLLKNPVVIAMLTAAVGMIVQRALATHDMKNICDHKYIKMAYEMENLNPQLEQILKILGCKNPQNQQYDSSTIIPGGKYSKSTTPSIISDDDNDDERDDEESPNEQEETLESGYSLPEKESKLQQLLSIGRGEKGAKRNFLRRLFGLNKKAFKQGQKLPSSSYKLDKDDANALKDLEKELEDYNKSIH